ncbi:MAG: rhomboid family intramembrane serine protease [Bdellovibrionales bacterium]|jgi:membrane associated rhomboid family serine protease|nr:rhomboid family intramembrane serine protease [Bdellovibrionales bacterium]
MIFPLLRGLLWFHRAPVTWLMVALNVAIFSWTYPAYKIADQAMEEVLDDSEFMSTTGLLLSLEISGKSELRTPAANLGVGPTVEPKGLRELAERSLRGDEDSRVLLGHIALRRSGFIEETFAKFQEQPEFAAGVGDAVAVEKWQEGVERLFEVQGVHPSYRLGLSSGRSEPWRWLTYQIAHSGFLHLFWNMIFLLIFGTFVEHSRGSLASFLTVWLGGLGGALVFTLASGLSASPLVGASAAVSALIAVAASNMRRRLPFVYWLLPIQGYYGVAWLPAWVLIPAFVLPDLSGWLSSQPGFSGVAYTAHLGGAFIGFALSRVFKERPQAFTELAQSVTGTAASSTRLAA